ncbi:MAG: hypothetical protein KJP07_19170 [Desulfatitalea sp.]|nr:hypothetical protein [Desulfatitalea sp.]
MKQEILNRLKRGDLPVIIGGAGIVGQVLFNICSEEGIFVECFCDGSIKASGSTFCGKQVVHTPELKSRYDDALVLISAAAIKDVVDLLTDMGFGNWYAGGLLLKDMDVSQDVKLDYRKFAIENCILCHDAFMHPDKIFIRSIDLIITERCSLRCKDCSNLMQYYEKPENVNRELLLKSIDAFFAVVDEVMDFRIIGGETFMNKEWPVFVKRISRQRRKNDPQIKRIVLYTNGTIVPKEKDLACLQNDKVLVIATDYGSMRSRRLDELVKVLESRRIAYHVLKVDEWLDCATIQPHDRTPEENQSIFRKCCAKNMLTLSDGKLFRCPYAANAARLSAVPDYRQDYIDLFEAPLDTHTISITKDALRHYLFHQTNLQTCDFCNGRPLSGKEVRPAEQASGPLAYYKYD